jgi:aminoglycoside phosphotransferase (APT) family kinase protein
MIKVLHQLHTLDYRDIGLDDFGRPVGYIRRQVQGWTKRYQAARTPDAPDCERIMAWLADHLPPDHDRPGLIHGDFKLDNLVVDPDDPIKISGILDWEMATIGDPNADLAYALIYWPASGDRSPPPYDTLPSVIRDAVSREQMLAYYEELSGRSIEHMDFYFSFNLFRLGAILQQIYYRYHQGLTRDKRFAALKKVVSNLMEAAHRAIHSVETYVSRS